SAEAEMLANWEYTAKNPYGDAFKDVLQALAQVNDANQDTAAALGAKNTNQAFSRDAEATRDVYQAYKQLAEASKDANSSVLAADATAMLAIYNQMQAHLNSGNFFALFQDTTQAQAIANKAVVDASPYR